MNYKRNKIIITQPEFEKGKIVFTNSEHYEYIPSEGAEDLLCKTIIEHQSRFVIVGILPYKNSLYEALPKTGLIARFGVGHDNINKALLHQRKYFALILPEHLMIP